MSSEIPDISKIYSFFFPSKNKQFRQFKFQTLWIVRRNKKKQEEKKTKKKTIKHAFFPQNCFFLNLRGKNQKLIIYFSRLSHLSVLLPSYLRNFCSQFFVQRKFEKNKSLHEAFQSTYVTGCAHVSILIGPYLYQF